MWSCPRPASLGRYSFGARVSVVLQHIYPTTRQPFPFPFPCHSRKTAPFARLISRSSSPSLHHHISVPAVLAIHCLSSLSPQCSSNAYPGRGATPRATLRTTIRLTTARHPLDLTTTNSETTFTTTALTHPAGLKRTTQCSPLRTMIPIKHRPCPARPIDL